MENFDISALSKELESIASKWEDLGSRLQISPETIQSLKSESCPDEDGLREVLRQWLETDEQRDLEVLTEAVSGIDQHLADSLKGKFCSTGEGEVEVNDKTATGEEVATVSEKPSADDGGAVKLTEELEESSAHLYSEKWSKLSREDVIDKIKGVIYGQAIGDAFGKDSVFSIGDRCSLLSFSESILPQTIYSMSKFTRDMLNYFHIKRIRIIFFVTVPCMNLNFVVYRLVIYVIF